MTYRSQFPLTMAMLNGMDAGGLIVGECMTCDIKGPETVAENHVEFFRASEKVLRDCDNTDSALKAYYHGEKYMYASIPQCKQEVAKMGKKI